MEPEQKEKLKQQFEEQRAAEIVKRQLALKEYWNTLKPFVNAHDVPTLPRVEKQEWEEFYVPKLIQAGAIKKEDLIDGVWYYGDYRNSTFGNGMLLNKNLVYGDINLVTIGILVIIFKMMMDMHYLSL